MSVSGPPTSILKSSLRRQFRQRLRQIDTHSLTQQGEQVFKHLNNLKEFQDSSRLSCYNSMSSGELPTRMIISNAISSNKKVFLPFVDDQDHMSMLELSDQQTFQDRLVPKPFSSSNPSRSIDQFDSNSIDRLENALTHGLDLILLPGVVFDTHGGRLGHGKGHYDRFIATLRARHPSRPVTLVGLALREQILAHGERVPRAEHDVGLDVLVGPDGIVFQASATAP